MIENEFHFTNPISLVIAKTIFGDRLKKACFILPIKNQRFNDGNRLEEQGVSLSRKLSEILDIEFDLIGQEEHFSNQSQVIEATLKRRLSPNGQTLIMTTSDIYCRFGFKNYKNFPITKQKLKKLWSAVDYDSKDLLYGFSLEGTKNRLTCEAIDIDITGVKNILREITLEFGFMFSNFFSMDNDKKYLLVMPYRHDKISENFSKRFFDEANIIAKEKNLKIILKSHPNDVFDYAKYFSCKEETLIMSDKLERHIPVELFLQSKQVDYTVSVPSSSLAFAELDRASVLVPTDRSLYRKKFLDQEPFLNRLKLNIKTI
jgi:hypothetical protein